MLLENSFYHNPINSWLIAVFIFLITVFALQVIKKNTIRQLDLLTKKTASEWDDLIPLLIQRFHFILFILFGLYLGALVLDLPDRFRLILKKTGIIAVLLQTAIWGSFTIRYWLNIYRKLNLDRNAGAYTTVSAVTFILQVILWTILFLLVLANVGVNITALLTGLGVTGIAVALAVQNILGDLFASFSIILDKPFVIGDFIIVDDYLGTIEKIGIKTTRIRSLSGEQLVFSNSDLLKSRIRNYKRMFERRVVFDFGVVYQTSYETLTRIPKKIQEIIEAQQPVRFDRAHFKEYGAYALNFEIVYWIQSPDYNLYMDIQQTINLALFQYFKENEIDFAYPTQSLFVAGSKSAMPE